MSEFNKDSIHTSCADCVFRDNVSNPDENHYTQVNCLVGRIAAFEASGTSPVEAVDEYPDKKTALPIRDEFYLIPGRVCRMKRTKQAFFKAYPEHKELDNGQEKACADIVFPKDSLDDFAKDARRRISLKVGLVVLVDKDHTLNDLDSFAQHLCSLTIVPTSFRLVGKIGLQKGKEFNQKLLDIFAHKYPEGSPFTWRIINVLEDTSTYEEQTKCVLARYTDIAVSRMAEDFPRMDCYHVMSLGDTIKQDYFQYLDSQISDYLNRFLCIFPVGSKDGEVWENYPRGMTVMSALHFRPDVMGHEIITSDDGKEVLWSIPQKIAAIFGEDSHNTTLVWRRNA